MRYLLLKQRPANPKHQDSLQATEAGNQCGVIELQTSKEELELLKNGMILCLE